MPTKEGELMDFGNAVKQRVSRRVVKGPEKEGRAAVKAFILLFLFLISPGCMVGPNYKRPVVDIPPSWRVEEKEAKEMADTRWWEQFNDPVLNGLIETALRENKDLKIAAARVEEFLDTSRRPGPGFFHRSAPERSARGRPARSTPTPLPTRNW